MPRCFPAREAIQREGLRKRSNSRLYGQVNKRTWGMPWRQEAKKDVQICEKLRQADKGRNNLRSPNGETRQRCHLCQEVQKRTRGSETSQYPEEKKSNEISEVAASETEGAQK